MNNPEPIAVYGIEPLLKGMMAHRAKVGESQAVSSNAVKEKRNSFSVNSMFRIFLMLRISASLYISYIKLSYYAQQVMPVLPTKMQKIIFFTN